MTRMYANKPSEKPSIMPITVGWYEDTQKNIHFDVLDVWTWQDLSIAMDESLKLQDSVDYHVKVIIDFTNSSYVPDLNFAELSKIANLSANPRPNRDKLIMVGANKYIKILFNVFKKIFPHAGDRYELYPDRATLEAVLYNTPE